MGKNKKSKNQKPKEPKNKEHVHDESCDHDEQEQVEETGP
jgi:hypothetical protein